jgi:hypothetical protein
MDKLTTSKIDPISGTYFAPLTKLNLWSDVAFYFAAALSIVVVLIPKEQHPHLYENAQAFFLVAAVLGFGLGLGGRLYWAPRAQAQRLSDFLSSALDVNLTHERTQQYYNNDEIEPFRKMGMQLLENSFFSREVSRSMCLAERVLIGGYALAWLLILTNRSAPVDLIVAISLVLLSEQLISRIFRLEWLRIQFEETYDAVYGLFQSTDRGRFFEGGILSQLVRYENAKANSGVSTSTKIFEKLNAQLSKQWEEIKKTIPKQ